MKIPTFYAYQMKILKDTENLKPNWWEWLATDSVLSKSTVLIVRLVSEEKLIFWKTLSVTNSEFCESFRKNTTSCTEIFKNSTRQKNQRIVILQSDYRLGFSAITSDSENHRLIHSEPRLRNSWAKFQVGLELCYQLFLAWVVWTVVKCSKCCQKVLIFRTTNQNFVGRKTLK